MLVFLSPVINAFIDKYGKEGLRWCVLFLIIEFWFDCITHTYFFGFNHGYSAIHFVLMYMIARYIFIYRDILLQFKRIYWVLGYVICSLIILVMYVCGVNYIWQYSNPVIIISAICSFIPFLSHHYVNHWINWIAQSTLSAYIIHVTIPVYKLVIQYDKFILSNFDYPIYLMLMLGGVIVVFVLSIVYDKLWKVITEPMYNYIVNIREKRYNGEIAA